MSMIPSLSVWSSVKLAFPKIRHSDETVKSHSFESWDNHIKTNHEVRKAEKAAKVVSLRVPRSQSVDKENSVPNIYCECIENIKHCKKKNRHISFVTVPEIFYYEKEYGTEKLSDSDAANFGPCESRVILQDKVEKLKSERFEEAHGEIDSVPSVKPWTLEELVEINRQKEEAKKKMDLRRNNINKRILKNHDRALEREKGFFRSDENSTFSPDDSFTDFTEHYYDCELLQPNLCLSSDPSEKNTVCRSPVSIKTSREMEPAMHPMMRNTYFQV